jgi:hypothetical protein
MSMRDRASSSALDAAALEAGVAAAIEACDGDLRATIRALILANALLEEELAQARAQLSRGFIRGRLDLSRDRT